MAQEKHGTFDLTKDEKMILDYCGNWAIKHFKLSEVRCVMFKHPDTGEYFLDVNRANGQRLETVRVKQIDHKQDQVYYEPAEITFERNQENLVMSCTTGRQPFENFLKPETIKCTTPKIGRNDTCSCGSGKKYKKCCGS